MDISSGTTLFQKKSWLLRARQMHNFTVATLICSPHACDIFLDFLAGWGERQNGKGGGGELRTSVK